MNMRENWTVPEESVSDSFYTRDETVANVKENFDLHRFHSSEGYDIIINGITERCLVQTAANPLRESNDYRKIHCPITVDVKRGYYVEYENSVWIIDTNVVNVDGAYFTTRMSRCQALLRWQNENGNIIERRACVSDQSKDSGGEKGDTAITVGENQYGLLVPIDAETKLLKRGMRIPFDFDDAKKPDVYKLTNRKAVLSEGTMQLSFSLAAFDSTRDRRITLADGSDAWICDYRAPAPMPVFDESAGLSLELLGGNTLRCGKSQSWTASVKDRAGNEITDFDCEWIIESGFEIPHTAKGRKIQLKSESDALIGRSFLLSTRVNHTVTAAIEITITEGF